MFGFAGREGGWAGLGWVFLLGWAGLGWAVGLAGGWGGRGLDSLGLGLGLEVLGRDWGSGAGAGLEGAGYLDVAAGLGWARLGCGLVARAGGWGGVAWTCWAWGWGWRCWGRTGGLGLGLGLRAQGILTLSAFAPQETQWGLNTFWGVLGSCRGRVCVLGVPSAA